MGEWVGIEPFLKNFLCVCGRGGGVVTVPRLRFTPWTEEPWLLCVAQTPGSYGSFITR